MFSPLFDRFYRWFKGPRRTKVVVEICGCLDPSIADRKYTDPLRQLLADNHAGVILDVVQGAPNTADEYTRILTLELSDFEAGLDIVGEFLVENDAPPGSLIQVYDSAGEVVDRLILTPD
jgi:hypothetical protein